MSSKEVYTPEMSIKEEPRSLRAVDLVVQCDNINLLKLVLPDENYRIEVLKTEGEYLSAVDLNSKLPKGYSLIRIYSQEEQIKNIGVNTVDLEHDQISSHQPHISAQIPPGNSLETLISQTVQSRVGTKPGRPETFRQGTQVKTGNFERKNYEEKASRAQDVPKTQNEDSLGYFKALNLNAADLSRLPEDEAKKKIKSNYREAAFGAHPDHGGSHDAMVKVNQAMSIISNPSLRSAYQHQTGQFASRSG